MIRATMVIPCFNEALRLSSTAFQNSSFELLFVDDGSTDRTLELLKANAPHSVLPLPVNVGKGEAVRAGLLRALAGGAAYVGYLDADLSTPMHEAARLLSIALLRPQLEAVLGVRLARMGADIDRSLARHYSGRVFATFAAQVLRTRAYDTQCGCKWFRATPALARALEVPFISRWAFDVELLGRLLRGTRSIAPTRAANILEEPLKVWRDVPGSKVTLPAALRAGVDLMRIEAALQRYASSDATPS
jgi:dolichyl-phosphate beta-glucosyltransferase